MKPDRNLGTFDNRLMNGLEFCRKVYEFFEQIRNSPGGVNRLRLRGKIEKKLIEELIPIARYIQTRYSAGRLLKVRWILGSQQYDARLLSAGALPENGVVPKLQYVEVTTVVHEHDHLLRSLISAQGHAFGVKGVSRDRKSRKIESKPHVYRYREAEDDLTKRILASIAAKNSKAYPVGTVLVIQCVPDQLMLSDDWEYVVQKVRGANVKHRFDEVFFFESRYTATL
ncbi:MAG: hypothetical protein NTW28_01555 [Candidatus Solibacter sp.]|nr:hypothetical protein [Candidatus Solibacter sp.]